MDVPSKEAVEKAFDRLRSLNAAQLQERIRVEIGPELMGLFGALARSSASSASEGELARTIHGMVLAYLLRGELEAPGGL